MPHYSINSPAIKPPHGFPFPLLANPAPKGDFCIPMGIEKDKLTDEQKREVERLRQFATRNRLELKMNSTRWRAAIDAMMAVEEYALTFRVRCITDPSGAASDWQSGFPEGLPLYNSIEWLEIQWSVPAGASKEIRLALKQELPKRLHEVASALKAAQIPHKLAPNGVIIEGYMRS
jgi:hypothetical protein